MNTTIVTALYNISREERGDGRTWKEYLEWFQETLQIPLPMVIFIPRNLLSFVESHRPSQLQTHVILQELQEIPYAYCETIMNEILQHPGYRQTVAMPNRVECKLAFYNIIQYSKFQWIKQAIQIDPFQSDYFFWMDAGISRFIPSESFSYIKSKIELPPGKLVIQNNYEYYHYPVDERYLWDCQCLLCGTMFGGDKSAMLQVAEIVDHELVTRLQKGWNNNEQILLAYIQRYIKPDLFHLVLNDSGKHLCLYDTFFISSK
jgi:hypothetical protein